jgi:serine protease Do
LNRRLYYKSSPKKAIIFVLALIIISAGSFLFGMSFFSGERVWTLQNREVLNFIPKIYGEVSPSVASVQSIKNNEESNEDSAQLVLGTGSGLIVSKDGYIITNFHVRVEAQDIIINLADGRQTSAEVIGSYPASDLALLKIDLPDLTAAVLGNSDTVLIGDFAFAIGNPGGEQFARSLTMGVISGVERELILSDGHKYCLLQTDAAINPGNSGGPLVNSRGEVIGINSVKVVDADFEGMGFAIPINTVKTVIETIEPAALTYAIYGQ